MDCCRVQVAAGAGNEYSGATQPERPRYEIYLDAGINDWGGVSPLTIDYVNPEAPWPALARLRDRTGSKGFELRPRLPVYPEFINASNGYLPAELKAKVTGIADDEGYVKGGIQRYAGFD